jgi:hypothetical protein
MTPSTSEGCTYVMDTDFLDWQVVEEQGKKFRAL